jgi:AhpD family alkylhydroperoxidase
MTRIAPVQEGDWSEQQRAVVARLLDGAPRISEPLGVVMRHVELFETWYPFAQIMRRGGVLPRRDREILILRVANRSDCAYEWAMHVEEAQGLGVCPETAASVAAEGVSPWDRGLIAAVDEICDRNRLSQDAWDALAARYDAAQMIECLFVIGHYRLLAGFFNSIALEIPPQQ